MGRTGSLLGLDKTSGAVDADGQAAGNLGVEGSRVASLLAAKDATDPGDDFVGGGVGGLVEVDDTGPVELLLVGKGSGDEERTDLM